MSSQPASESPGRGRGEQRDSRLVREAVRRAQRGDRQGMHFLYARFALDVQRHIAGLVDDNHEAEDITRAVFAKLPTSIGKYQEREVPFGSWILRVARNSLRSRC